jgi:hypothetical protein
MTTTQRWTCSWYYDREGRFGSYDERVLLCDACHEDHSQDTRLEWADEDDSTGYSCHVCERKNERID